MANLENRIARLERTMKKAEKRTASKWFIPAVIVYRTKAELVEGMKWEK